MRGADLTPVLTTSPPSGVDVKVGEVSAWNTTTGANTVTVNGVNFTNLRVVGAITGVVAGDWVVVISSNGRWYVLGKLTRP